MEKAWVGITNPFRQTLTATVCGHETKQKGPIIAFGKISLMSMPVDKNGHTEYCLSCIGKMSIRCAWCGESIRIGNAVTLYMPTNESFIPPEYAVRYKGDERCFVGCLRWNCADSGADMCGHWMPPGEVERCLSPIELALGGNMVIVPDLSQYPNGVSVIPHQ